MAMQTPSPVRQAPNVIKNSKPRIWFHIHIPKTAGSTLRHILARNFENSYFSAVSLLEHHKLGLSETSEIVDKHHRWLRCYSDHRLSLDIPFDSDVVDTRALAFVRNPVDQVVSQYNFQKQHNRRKTEVAMMSLEEFIEKKFNKPRRLSKGLQLQRLKGTSFGTSTEAIKQLLDEQKLFLFPLEEFDLACACLEKLFPEEFYSAEYFHANKSPRKTTPDQSIRHRIRELVSPDFEIHDIATWFLSTLASTVFDSPVEQMNTVSNLKQRCKAYQDKVLASTT
ncbi:MAG: sulfotransferase family 2 domain-containing protein [Planctomycetota bacterium]|nr:sulfotransferase family 2 domain-containing protein [Planctomycetota bacterium]